MKKGGCVKSFLIKIAKFTIEQYSSPGLAANANKTLCLQKELYRLK
jgi:hypothetical protein